jgi:hypothetical protein
MKARFFQRLDLNREYGAIPATRLSVVNTLKHALSTPVMQGRSFHEVRKSKYQRLLDLLEEAHRDAVISNNPNFLEKVHNSIIIDLEKQIKLGLLPNNLQNKLDHTARYLHMCTFTNEYSINQSRPQLKL